MCMTPNSCFISGNSPGFQDLLYSVTESKSTQTHVSAEHLTHVWNTALGRNPPDLPGLSAVCFAFWTLGLLFRGGRRLHLVLFSTIRSQWESDVQNVYTVSTLGSRAAVHHVHKPQTSCSWLCSWRWMFQSLFNLYCGINPTEKITWRFCLNFKKF